MNQREHMIERIARSLAWYDETHDQRVGYLRRAEAVVNSLFTASAEGKAIERALHVIKENGEAA